MLPASDDTDPEQAYAISRASRLEMNIEIWDSSRPTSYCS
jgi:hypothetical protein